MEEMFLQALITVFIGLILYILTKLVERQFINYNKFKEELINTKTNLNFYSNILTNRFTKEETTKSFQKYVIDTQKEIRKNWAKLEARYTLVNKTLFKKHILTKKELETLLENLIYLSNRRIIVYNNNQVDDVSDSIKRYDNTLKIINKYL
ncbi:MAG: hypothetical protein ACMXX6_01875 [Candidatus Woesearchaeota archaeon]